MGMHLDPSSNRVRPYGSNGYPIDGKGYGSYVEAADTDKQDWDRRKREEAEQEERDRNKKKREAEEASSRAWSGSKNTGNGGSGSPGIEIFLLLIIGGIVILSLAIFQTASTLIRYHWIETLVLGVVTAGAFFASSRREELFPRSEMKQKALHILAWCLLCVSVVVPPTLAVRSYFFRPSLPLAIEKLDSFFFFNAENYREFGAEGVSAILNASRENPEIPRGNVYAAVASTGEAGVLTVKNAIGQSKEDRGAAICSVPRLGEFAPLVLPELLDCLTLPWNSDEWSYAARVLRELGPVFVPGLTRELSSWSDKRRACAAYALALLGEGARPALPMLEEGITDSYEVARQNCLWAISLLGHVDASTATKVAKALRDPFQPARANAVDFFWRHPEHIQANYSALYRASTNEENVQLRMNLQALMRPRTTDNVEAARIKTLGR